jgi:hypothetical protein
VNEPERNPVVPNRKLIAEEIVEVLQRHPACTFETLVASCSEFTWNQIFAEVDRMCRLGQLRLVSRDDGRYIIGLPITDESQEAESAARASHRDV